MAAKSKRQFSEADLARWRLVEEFESRLERAAEVGKEPRTFSDPRRKLGQKDYLSLLLFGLFNPVVDSMRGLCAASRLERVQEEICSAKVSLGSFSEAQAVVDPRLLQRVFAELAAEQQCRNLQQSDQRLEPYRAQLWSLMAHCGERCRAWHGRCGAINTARRARYACISNSIWCKRNRWEHS
jgi:hypothetical protein